MREDRAEFIVTQLVNIAEHGHPLREQIFEHLFLDFIPRSPNAVLDGLIAKVTSGQTSNQDSLPYYLADFALSQVDGSRKNVLASLLLANDELMVYIVASQRIDEDTMLSLIEDGVIGVDTILRKLSLFIRYVRQSKKTAEALLPKLKEHQLVKNRQDISLDQLTDFMTLAQEI